MSVFKKFIDKLNYILEEERENLILWLPVLFIIGSLIRFNYFNNPINIKYLNISLIFIVITIIVISYLTKNLFTRIITIILIFILLGYLRTEQIIKKYNFPIIDRSLGKVKITGFVEKEIISVNKKKTVVVLVDKIEPLNDKKLFLKNGVPKKLKITLSNSNQKINLSKIVLIAYIFPIEKKIIYSDFDNRRYLYFQEIGGIGYRGEVLFNNEPKKLTIKQKIDVLRNRIAERILNIRPYSKSVGIIAILLTGQKNLADKQTVENINMSGLAHILAISGLHMMTLILFILYLSNWILMRSEKIILNYNIQKISIIIALIVSVFYLLLSGMSVSAVRAYIMSTVLMFSFIIGRFNTSLRSVMFTMFIFVFIKPFIIFSAGFQMSFMAVISLITASEYYNKNIIKEDMNFYKISKYKRYIITGFILSLAAEFAVTPFVIYNFNYYSFYNIFVNSFITPIISFIILPLSFLSLLLMPLKLEALFIVPASIAMDIIINIANFIVKIPNSFIFVESQSVYCLFIMIFGLLLFCLLKSNLRKIGILLYFLAFGIFFLQKKPDIIIDSRDNTLIFLDEKNNFYILNPNKYKIATLLRKFGEKNYVDLKKEKLNTCKLSDSEFCTKLDIEDNIYYFYKNNEIANIEKFENKFVVKNKSKKLKILEL